MPAVDAIKYSLSHFDNSDIWFKASYDLNVKTGWLGRWIDRNGSSTNPLQAISIDTALSKSIRTAVNPVCAIPSLAALGFSMNSPGGVASNVNPQMQALAGLPPAAATPIWPRAGHVRGRRRDPPAGGRGTPVRRRCRLSEHRTLSTRLRLAAHLLAANLGTRIITIHWGGFDTHSGQLASQDAQLTELSRALGAFRADLAARGIEQRVCTLVFSEFGRRVRENGSAGTDHGAGGLMLAMGSAVRGGLASEWPGCRPQDLVPANNPAQGNLKVPTDYRSVYRSVIAEWLGDDPDAMIGGGRSPRSPAATAPAAVRMTGPPSSSRSRWAPAPGRRRRRGGTGSSRSPTTASTTTRASARAAATGTAAAAGTCTVAGCWARRRRPSRLRPLPPAPAPPPDTDTPPAPLPSRTSVDLDGVAGDPVLPRAEGRRGRVQRANLGEDEHDFSVRDASGKVLANEVVLRRRERDGPAHARPGLLHAVLLAPRPRGDGMRANISVR